MTMMVREKYKTSNYKKSFCPETKGFSKFIRSRN